MIQLTAAQRADLRAALTHPAKCGPVCTRPLSCVKCHDVTCDQH